MNECQLILQDHHKSIHLRPERVSFYLQGEIIEAFNDNNEVFYLFLYKYQFLTAVKATKIRRHSYIEAAFTKGIVFNAPHPLIHLFISSNQTLKLISLPHLLKKLKKQYHPHVRAFIFTFFESFIPKKQLFNEIISIFYEYRRNGQMYLGYRIIRILADFAPTHSLVKQLAGDLQFSKYAVLYNEKQEKVFAKDLIFAEKTLYAERDQEQRYQQLVKLLEQESRWLDLMALYIDKLTKAPLIDDFLPLKKLVDEHFNEQDTICLLEMLACQLPTFLPVQQELFNCYVKTSSLNKIFQMMNTYNFQLSNKQLLSMGDISEYFDSQASSLDPEKLKNLLNSLLRLIPVKAEEFLHKAVIILLKTYEPPYVIEWLSSFKKEYAHVNVFEKMDTIQKLSEDLDHLQTLGELYVDFRQWDKAIECFSWEMELKPFESKPLQWLTKIYRELGMTYEANAFQQLCINIQKHA